MDREPLVKGEHIRPPTSFLSLPPELRDQIYHLHLESLDYETSRPLDPRYQAKDGETTYLSARESWQKKLNPVRYPGYFNPVWHEHTRWHNAGVYVEVNRSSIMPWRAREHSLPALMRLDSPAQVAREARDLFIGQKLIVGEDSLNWFQTWCLNLPDEDRAAIRKLTIAARVDYDFAPDPYWNTLSRPAQLTIGEICLLQFSQCQDEVPSFVIFISDDGKEITVHSRFQLAEHKLPVLRHNLGVLLRPLLQNVQRRFDGNDILEAMFAFHNHCTQDKRSLLVIGSVVKRKSRWSFDLVKGDAVALGDLERKPSPVLEELHAFGKVDRYEVFRASAGGGVPEMCWLGGWGA
jgi:hypothetical protein